jgi:hypothetical protein
VQALIRIIGRYAGVLFIISLSAACGLVVALAAAGR